MHQYEIPQTVMENAEKRLAVAQRRRLRTCAIDGCDQPATHSPCCGYDACETHRVVTPNPTPDPLRTEAHLRATRGSAYTPNRTAFDTTVEAKGQRIGAARRAHLRGDNDPKEAPDAATR